MEDEQETIPPSPHLRNSLAALGVALLCVLASAMLAWEWICVLWQVMCVALLYGWITAFAGLRVKSNPRGLRRWMHIGILVAIPILGGLANIFSLVDLRMRLAVTFTGGQDELQAWAIKILDEPRGSSGQGSDDRIPRERWSEQVRRLKPKWVRIEPLFEDGGEAVRLCYGGGFYHWNIVVGRPGSRPDPKFNDPDHDEWWTRWGDGLYNWQQG
jgi:hypothetical protein